MREQEGTGGEEQEEETPGGPKELLSMSNSMLTKRELHNAMARKTEQISVTFFAKVGNGKSSSANTLLRAWGYEGPPFESKRQRGAVTSELQTIEHTFHIPGAAEPKANQAASLVEGELGDRLQALPGQDFQEDGVDFYKEGDCGTITKVYRDDKFNRRIKVVWERTGESSGCFESEWRERYKFISKSDVTLCVRRLPLKGDPVRRLGNTLAQERNSDGVIDAWFLQPDEVAIVVDIDQDNDFKLQNPSGEVSGWLFRSGFVYGQEDLKPAVLRVTDQPGLMDAQGHAADAAHLKGTALSGVHQEGYHVLFVVEKITDRLDATEQVILRTLKKFYGEAVCHHVVLLLTHSDVLDDEEEIQRMVAESKADVENELGHSIAAAIPINNHPSKADSSGRDSAQGGHEMLGAISDIVAKFPEPFKPPEVDYDAVAWYVDEEVERTPGVDRNMVLRAVLRFIPVANMDKLCLIL
jgi:hypothetical protein